jgi:hypothetical protein
LKGKKLITIVVGGGKIENSKRVGEQALKYFSDGHQLELIGSYYFQALHLRDIENSSKSNLGLDKIISKINK